ncbi:MAG: alpha-mannosidase [Verrucomicrobiales bacterium]|nr:alpha-mannosidase [Verrucomicrobiales bacterium]
MQKHFEITRSRLQHFADLIRARLYTKHLPADLEIFTASGRITFAEALRGDYRPARVGEQFGPLWSTHWFKVVLEIPQAWQGEEVHLLWDSTSEACVWEDGQPRQGLTGCRTIPWADLKHPIRADYCLTKSASGSERRTLHIEMACNGLFGADGIEQPGPSEVTMGLLRQAEIATFDRAAWRLLWDFTTITEMALHLPPDSPRAGQALYAANRIVNICDLNKRETWPAAIAIAENFLAARNGDGQHNLSAVGHAHIDTAWLWPLAETKRKCYRTFSTALRYMEDYPEYQFVCSQAQQFAWMKELQPALYQKIKQRVQEGRFIPVGGTWIEPDCNIPSGESLVRQFLIGQRFFQKEYGATCTEFWNPDVFGYCAQLPQIMRGAGIKYFLTQKLSWNQFNKPASHTFLWEGIDGSRVLTHFPPADTYNGTCTVKELLFNVKNFKDHERANESYYLFGYGDGGGGPTTEMLERLQRVHDVDGVPRVVQRSPRDFFARCEADIKDPLVWVGELYFELHRGTYTTQARNKLHNRRCESLLHDIEALAAIAHCLSGFAYPAEELDRLWKLVLLNQFHDIIPGSSIAEVYQDSEEQYAEVLASGMKLRAQARQALCPERNGKNLAAFNTLGFPRTEVVAFDGRLATVHVPALGYAVAAPGQPAFPPVQAVESADAFILENQFVRATFRRDGGLVSLFDKQARREAIEPGGTANNFVLFDDEPNKWDAWDVEVFHLEKRHAIPPAKSVRLVECDPLRATIEVEQDLSAASKLRQRISLTAVSARLDFETEVDWNEHHKFLKVEFPLNLRTEQATYEIQFGHLQRPTHFNTSWDVARFEVCAQRWADLAEPGFGVALLNDCKYGHAAQGNILRLSLLRAPKYPDPNADIGHHTFRYALLPHAGDFRSAGVIEEAARFNAPLHISATDTPPATASFFRTDTSAVVIDTVKKAEDSEALIVRLYEAHGSRGTVRLTSSLPIATATCCNLLEEGDTPLSWADGGVNIEFTPFQILTVKLLAAGSS